MDLPGVGRIRGIPDWQLRIFNSTSSVESAPDADPDDDGNSNLLEYLTGTNPLNAEDAWSLAIEELEGGIRVVYPRLANRGFELQARGLMGRRPVAGLGLPSNAPVPSTTPGVVEVDLPYARFPGSLSGPYFRVLILSAVG